MLLKKRTVLREVAYVLYVAALVAVAAVFGPAQAQESSVSVEQAGLQLWPEYDDPGLLVIFSGSMASNASLPLDFAWQLPDEARGIQATIDDPSQGLLTQPWDRSDGALVYTLPQAAFHIEYYVDRPPSGDLRQISYTLVAPYAISTLDISIQQPARATDFTVTPDPDGSFIGNDGFTYYQINRRDVAAGEQIAIALSYSKPDQDVSVAPALETGTQGTTTTSTDQVTSSGGGPAKWLPWLLIGAGAVILVGMLAYWLIPSLGLDSARKNPARRRRTSTADAHSESSAAPHPNTITKTSTGGAAFCPTCGHRFGPEDRFCASCGAARRPQE